MFDEDFNLNKLKVREFTTCRFWVTLALELEDAMGYADETEEVPDNAKKTGKCE